MGERDWKTVPLDPAKPDGFKVHTIRERDYLFPKAHLEYTPVIEAYVDRRDLPTLFRLLEEGMMPAEALACFDYLTEADRTFGLRTMLETLRRMEELGRLDPWPHLKGL